MIKSDALNFAGYDSILPDRDPWRDQDSTSLVRSTNTDIETS